MIFVLFFVPLSILIAKNLLNFTLIKNNCFANEKFLSYSNLMFFNLTKLYADNPAQRQEGEKPKEQ